MSDKYINFNTKRRNMKFITVGFIGNKRRQDTSDDFNLARDRLNNYSKGYVKTVGSTSALFTKNYTEKKKRQSELSRLLKQ